MGKTKEKGEYYYAGGRRIPIVLADDYIAVNSDSLSSPKLSKKARQQLSELAQPLRGGICLVNRSELDTEVDRELLKECDSQPVYRHDGVLMVALPEIRIEESTPERSRRVDGWLEEHRKDAEVVSRKPGRIVVRPTSGNAREALLLANELHESVGPEMVQSRFVRIVPKHRGG